MRENRRDDRSGGAAKLSQGWHGDSFPHLPKNRGENPTAHEQRRDSAERFNRIDDGHVRIGEESTGAERRQHWPILHGAARQQTCFQRTRTRAARFF
jgi:hypothetical protein